jgi:FeoB-associated Cys-rich membrane protein
MGWQLWATGILIALAAAYVLRSTWRAVRGANAGCGSGCGKCSTSAPDERSGMIPLSQISANGKKH